MSGLVPIAEVVTAQGNDDALTFTALECHALETLEFFDGMADGGVRARDIDLYHFLGIDGRAIGEHKTDFETFANSFHL